MAQKSLLVGVNRPADFKNLTDLEKKHLPVLEAPETVAPGECFELLVEVGKLLAHPNEQNHFIQFLDVYADRTYLARVDFTAVSACAKVTLRLALEAPAEELRAYAHCNMHGTWVGSRPIQVAG